MHRQFSPFSFGVPGTIVPVSVFLYHDFCFSLFPCWCGRFRTVSRPFKEEVRLSRPPFSFRVDLVVDEGVRIATFLKLSGNFSEAPLASQWNRCRFSLLAIIPLHSPSARLPSFGQGYFELFFSALSFSLKRQRKRCPRFPYHLHPFLVQSIFSPRLGAFPFFIVNWMEPSL